VKYFSIYKGHISALNPRAKMEKKEKGQLVSST